MSDLLDLAARVEAASADEQRVLLVEACQLIRGPKPESDYQPRRAPMFAPDWEQWVKRVCRFSNMLNAEAYESAAMMLVPEGYRVHINIIETGQAAVALTLPGGDLPVWGELFASAALAMTAACLRAHAAREAQDA